MSTGRLFTIIIVILALSGCGRADQTVSDSASVPTSKPTAELPSTAADTAVPESTAAQDEVVTPKEIPTEESSIEPKPGVEENALLPEPTLFDTSWHDKEIFRAGLIETEQAVLDTSRGASVYHMELTIDEPTSVDGQMQVHVTNQEENPLQDIYFHLFPDQLGGSITVSEVTVNGAAVQPEIQETALRVPLASALEPGQSAVVQMDFVTTVPPEEESTKYNILAFNDDILALAHFYPMIAVHDDQGWHTEPTPPHGDETYADMSHFLVRVTAPQEQVIVASGVEVDRSAAGPMQTVTIAAGPVRDFYLVMSDRYGVISDSVGPVQVNSYAPQELLDGAEFALNAATESLRSFNIRYGPYPYSELDIVSTPTQALGVEYPGIFANALRIYDLSLESSSGLPNAALLESVTAHETAHQWFYNLVGNDQLNEPWLDEATAQYATWMYYVDRYGEQNADGYYQSLLGRWERTGFADIPIGMPAEDYDGQEYGAIVYGRGPIFLDELAQEMGQETFDTFLREYSKTFRWEIATSEDFQALAEQHCQCDLSAMFDEAVYAN